MTLPPVLYMAVAHTMAIHRCSGGPVAPAKVPRRGAGTAAASVRRGPEGRGEKTGEIRLKSTPHNPKLTEAGTVSDSSPLRHLPSVHSLLQTAAAQELEIRYGHERLVAEIRRALDRLRAAVLQDGAHPIPTADEFLLDVGAALAAATAPSLRPVINATGVIVHTNLGRSVLAEAAARAVYDIARSYSNLEADLARGCRSSRHVHISRRLAQIVGAPAALVVNNNAAAVMLALAAIARDREVIVSRGQLVEIGGAFRIPEVIQQSGCILREVGSTNRTHLHDYQRAIGDNTAAILRAHQSNYRIIGFTVQPSLRELCDLAHGHGLPVVDDLGSGALLDLQALGVGAEPTVRESIEAGADVITFSGDKLLGGPQCGIAVGRPELIEAMQKHPLARAVRVGKLTIAALAATLELTVDPARAMAQIPTLRAATEPQASVEARARELAQAIGAQAAGEVSVTVVTDRSARVGGGSLPEEELPTASVRLAAAGISADELARRLRLGDPAVYTRIQDDHVVLDARTIFPQQVQATAKAVAAAIGRE